MRESAKVKVSDIIVCSIPPYWASHYMTLSTSQWPQLSQTCYQWQGARRGREMRVKLCLYLCPTLESSSSLIWRCLSVCTVGLFSRKQSFLVSLDKSCWKFVSVIEHFQHCHVRWNLNVILYWPLTRCEDKSLRFAPDRVLSTIYSVQFPVTSLRTLGTRKCSQIF